MALLRPCRRLLQVFGKLPVSCQFDYIQCIERATRTQGYITVSPKPSNSNINSENLELPMANNSTSDTTWPSFTPDLQRTLLTLCLNVKNNKFRNQDLLRIIKSYTSSKDAIEESVSLIVLRCCGNLLPNVNSTVRQNLAKQVWGIISRDNAELTLEHYNTLLSIHLQNNQPVESKNFLNYMIVKPDSTTYRLLLQIAARHGDVESALHILEEMKNKGFSMTEEMFNLLILTHSSNKDTKAALSTLEMMKDQKIEPSVETYANIACGYASIGDYQNTIKILNNYSLNVAQIMEIIRRLSSSNLGRHIPNVLRILPSHVSLDNTIILNTLTELTYNCRPEDAFEVINWLPAAASDDESNFLYKCFLKGMIRDQIPNSTILKFMNIIMTEKNYPFAIMDVCESALQAGDRELAMTVFEVMHEKKIDVRPHYYWPLLLNAYRNHGESELFRTLRHMLCLNVRFDHDTLFDNVLPHINTIDPLITLRKLCDLGLKTFVIFTPLICYLLNQGRIKEAVTLCSTIKAPIDFYRISGSLAKAYKTSKSINDCVEILKYVQAGKHYPEKFLLILFGKAPTGNNLTLLNEFLRAFKDAGITVSNFTSVEKRKEDKDVEREITLKNPLELIRPTNEIRHLKDMNVQELECHRIELKGKGIYTNLRLRIILRKLLLYRCNENDVTRAEEIKNEYVENGFKWTSRMYWSLLQLYLNNGRIEDALNLYSQIQVCGEHKLPDFRILQLATALVNSNMINEAFALLESTTANGGFLISRNCWRLLNAVAHSSSSELTESMLQVLVNRGFCRRTNTIMGPLVRAHLLREDLEAAVDTFKRCGELYGQTPLSQELVYALVKSWNDDVTMKNEAMKLLQDVQSIMRKIRGDFPVKMDYFMALARFEIIDELRNFLLNNSISCEALYRKLTHVPEERKLRMLTTLLNVSAGMSHVHRSFIYEQILSLHSRTGDCEQAIELWKRFSEEDEIVISRTFRIHFVNLLTRHNVPLPKGFSHTRFDQ